MAAQNIAALPKRNSTTKAEVKAKQRQADREQRRINENAKKGDAIAKKLYSHEEWESIVNLNLQGVMFPKGIMNIKVAKSRIPKNKNDELVLLKEVRQAKTLIDIGAFVYLVPKEKDVYGNFLSGPDAIVNGSLVEFKTVTGTINKVERRFRESRKQGENVFLKIDNSALTKQEIIKKLVNVVNDPKYTGGYKGYIILHIEKTKRTYYIKISSLKK
jgi:hypothetical protein